MVATHAASPDDGRVEEIRIRSHFMQGPVKIRVWLPPGSEIAGPGTLPLLVFLHDGFGSERSFVRKGLATVLEGMVARGEVAPVAVASPRTVGTYNSNDYLGRQRAFDFLTESLVPELLDLFPQLRRDRGGRGVTGISLGGYGALKIALRNPARFGSVSALSPWIEDLSFDFQMTQGTFGRWSLGRVFGKDPKTSTITRESLFRILAEPVQPGEVPRLLLMSGNDDPWVKNGSFERLERKLSAAGIAFETIRSPGDHEWPFWREAFPRIVRFHLRRFESR